MSGISRNVCRRALLVFKSSQFNYQASLSAVCIISKRCYVKLPEVYLPDNDPAPYFFNYNVQNLLKYLARPDYDKIFRKKTNKGDEKLRRPQYKFMTTDELESAMKNIAIRAEKLLKMPPVVKVASPIETIISQDPALIGYDESKFIFTDISFGASNNDRLITVREVDGTLKHAGHEIREKMNQIYFPMFGRKLKSPTLFTDQTLLDDLFERQEYEFVLERACVQYEPYDEKYQRIVSQAYQHCNRNKKYALLRSTRHFGPMAFYLAWNSTIDDLILDLLHTGVLQEAVCLVNLYQKLHPEQIKLDSSTALSEKILADQKNPALTKESQDSNPDFDEECLKCIEEYVNKYSTMKSVQELAIQSLRESIKQKFELQKGLEVAHGHV